MITKLNTKKGKENLVADALSRITIKESEIHELNNTDERETAIIDELADILESMENPTAESIIDEPSMIAEPSVMDINDLDDLLRPLEDPNSENDLTDIDNNETIQTQHTSNENPICEMTYSERNFHSYQNKFTFKIGEKHTFKRNEESNCINVILNRGNIENDLKDFLLQNTRPKITYAVYFHDPEIEKIFINLTQKLFNSETKFTKCNKVTAFLAKENFLEKLIHYHSQNHNGIIETIAHFNQRIYTPKMKQLIINYINKCEICKQAKYDRHPYKPKIQGPLIATRPMEHVFIDILTLEGRKFLTLIDLFSKYAQLYYITDSNSTTLTKKLKHYLSHHNIPKKITADNEFNRDLIKEFVKLHKVEIHFTTPKNPSSNSPIERLHSTIIEKLRVLRIQDKTTPIEELVVTATLIYNQSVHSLTNYTPFTLLYGPRDDNDSLIPDLEQHYRNEFINLYKTHLLPFYQEITQRQSQKEASNLDRRNVDRQNYNFQKDQVVFIKDYKNERSKTSPRYEKAIIIDQLNDKVVQVLVARTKQIKNIAINRIKRDNIFQENDPDSNNIPDNPVVTESPRPGHSRDTTRNTVH